MPQRCIGFPIHIEKNDCSDVQHLCTLDIKRLYTNIPYLEGITTVRDKLSENTKLTNQMITSL